MFYATLEADGGRISAYAIIYAFETMDEVRRFLLEPYTGAVWNLTSAEIEPGRFGDAWVKVHSAPRIEDGELIAGLFDGCPFRAAQLRVLPPGQHPGGRAWWIEPIEEVLVVAKIEETEAA